MTNDNNVFKYDMTTYMWEKLDFVNRIITYTRNDYKTIEDKREPERREKQ